MSDLMSELKDPWRWYTRRYYEWLRRRRGLGNAGERVAARYLKRQGFRVLARNVKMTAGEVDLLAEWPEDRKTLIVVEVKTLARETTAVGETPRPEAMVHAKKQSKLMVLADSLLKRRLFGGRRVRFDVIGVDWPEGGRPVVRHHPGAFGVG